MGIRRVVVVIALLGGFFVPTPSLAAPIRLEFTGSWQFFDPQIDSPDFWSAMNAAGVVQGSPLTLSMLVNDTDTNSDPTRGRYQIRGGEIQFGNVLLALQPSVLDVAPSDIRVLGSSLSGPSAGAYSPFYWQFTNDNSSARVSDDLVSVLSDLQVSPSFLFVGYRAPMQCGICLGIAPQLTLTRVNVVPEPASVALILSGLFVFVVRYRRSLLPRPHTSRHQ
jgi:hypothetical protein